MSFDDSDLREIFRRAFDEEGTPPRRPRPNSSTLPSGWWRSRWFWLGLLLLLILISFNRVVFVYTEWLWFVNIDAADVWLKSWGARAAAFGAAFVIALLTLWINIAIAMRGALRTSVSAFQPAKFRGFRLLLLAAAIFLAFTFGSAAAANWEAFLQFIYRAPSEVRDPLLGQSLSFYFFELPVYRFVRGWFLPLIFFSGVAVVGVYAVHSVEALRSSSWRPQNLAPLRRHIAILGALLALLIAIGHYFDRFSLMTGASSDLVEGPGYTDVTITLRVFALNALLMLLVAGALLLNLDRLRWRPVVAAIGIWFFSLIVLGGIVPGLVERYVVIPNRLSQEGPYIADTIEYTRMAYGLNDVEVRDFGRVTTVSAQKLQDNAEALTNIRLWDYRVLPQNYEQLQALRTYYQFSDVDIDRYVINGEVRQVMLAARELEKTVLPNRTWENTRLEFTHGYGIVMNPVDRFTRDGQPEFFISDIPPVSTVDIELNRPEIYYGQMIANDDIVFVGTERGEFDYPLGENNVRTTYAGSGGVPIRNALRKLLFAFRFGEINVWLNDDIGPDTRVMFHRNIVERVRRITPFLMLDNDPYIIVADGRLVWMIDAYTVSGNYPYSQRFTEIAEGERKYRGLNYIRNTVKITIDAYDGTVNYYQVDDDDPIINTYARTFPGIFKPMEEMPRSLFSHVRYPEDLFSIQTQIYLVYHMTDVNTFFNKEDVWAIPLEVFAEGQNRPMEPYYIIFNLPGEPLTEYLLIQPYTPADKDNMVAWLAARNDPPHYGELIAYTLPKQQVVDGPIQIEAQIEQDSEISPQLSLWNEGSSRAIRGNLIVIPLGDSFLYVEPLYLQSSGEGSRPELKRVVVASGGDVIMRETLGEALAELVNVRRLEIGQGAVVVEEGNSGSLPPDDEDPADEDDEPAVIETDLAAVIASANANFEAAQAAQQAGDWAAYGEALQALEADLQRMQELSGEQ